MPAMPIPPNKLRIQEIAEKKHPAIRIKILLALVCTYKPNKVIAQENKISIASLAYHTAVLYKYFKVTSRGLLTIHAHNLEVVKNGEQ